MDFTSKLSGQTQGEKQLGSSTQAWPLRRVGLRVQDLAQTIDFYSRLGFAIVRDEREATNGGSVGLGVGTREILSLRHLPGGHPRPPHSAGLYHFAVLLPTEQELGTFLRHCLDEHIRIDGASDHLVSQALYLSDPEGNGIEVYADRPRAQWPYRQKQLQMDTLRLDTTALLKKAQSFRGFSEQTCLGHMHLNVGNLERSATFYQSMGMALMIGMPNSASFLSWEGYHHHLGINVWAGRNVRPAEEDAFGLDFFELHRDGLSAIDFQDPDGVTVLVR